MTGIMVWLQGRVARTGIRRWLVIVVVALGIVWLSRKSSHASWSRAHALLDRIGQPVEELPRVDRSALDKLRLLEIHHGADEDDDHALAPDPPAHDRLDRPPLVAEIPEPDKPSALAPVLRLDKIPADILDEQVCGAAPGHSCQFLVPAWLGEQETKAQQHLHQLGLLALALNRTLVLPNVSKSRLGTCYKHPFSFYYAPDSLSALGIRTISQEEFLAWTLQRDPAPSAQVVSMINAKPGLYPQGAVEIDSAADPFTVPSKPNRNLCLRSPRSKLDFNTHSPLAIYPPEGFHKSEAGRLGFGQSVINTLLSPEVGARSSRVSSSKHYDYSLPDVMAFNYELRFPIVTPASIVSSLAATDPSIDRTPIPELLPFAHFPYASVWTDLADEMTSKLAPFISIHWRTETLTPSNLLPCSQSLLSKIFSLKEQYPEIENVYLATDYPIEQLDASFSGRDGDPSGAVAHSGTFAKSVTEQHHSVMRKFLRDFERRSKRLSKGTGGHALRLTTFAKEEASLTLDRESSTLSSSLVERLVNLTTPAGVDRLELELDQARPDLRLNLGALDSGLLGILDKSIVMKSQLFLTGVPGIGSSTKGACAKLSSFTNQLINAREELVLQQRGSEGEDETGRRQSTLWNTVQHWSLTGEEVD
ncbi:uncharacterized protein JCM15063_004190 [Sporobolomyces koalae]|uniref:uncharacterized protein n=1 Tax=Sporobolomyces koalae TaxID=500713 RepID=UPI003180A6FB